MELHQGENCPCPSDCKRRSDCKACIAFHHMWQEQTYCEFLYERAESVGSPPDTPVLSGREIRLMDYGPCAGWAGKLNPTRLAGILKKIPKTESPDLLVGVETMDDAGVFRITDDIALVQTVDFFFPVVNDPRTFGRIVAANSLSDIWAMGAKAITAMNLLAYPAGKIPPEVIEQLLTGGQEKLLEAGVIMVGGHTMEQVDFVYGMSVTGVVHPESLFTNSHARVGDTLILTKSVGTGVFSSALVENGLTEHQHTVFVRSMERLNKYASETLLKFDVSAATDVTGFGLLGHSLPIAKNAGVTLVIHGGSVPFFPGILDLMERFNPKGVSKCQEFVQDVTRIDEGVDPRIIKLLCEAQTSGGLLVAVRAEEAPDVIEALHEAGDPDAVIIGEVASGPDRNEKAPIYLQITM